MSAALIASQAAAHVAAVSLSASQPVAAAGSTDYNPWLQTFIYFISAVAAVMTIRKNTEMARKRATVDLIMLNSSDTALIEATKLVFKLSRKGKLIKDYDNDSSEKRAVSLVLSKMEFAALGIRKKVFDEEIYKELKRSDTIALWKACSGFIYHIRYLTGKDTIFQEFEWLHDRWEHSHIDCHAHKKSQKVLP